MPFLHFWVSFRLRKLEFCQVENEEKALKMWRISSILFFSSSFKVSYHNDPSQVILIKHTESSFQLLSCWLHLIPFCRLKHIHSLTKVMPGSMSLLKHFISATGKRSFIIFHFPPKRKKGRTKNCKIKYKLMRRVQH